MKIGNKLKRATTRGWCRHTDNNYGGRNHKAVRIGKRIIRKKLNSFLNKYYKE